ncbi:transglutaminase-like cysteine peptidase [Sphingomonas montanisoli]|uniref:Transglutaminase-like cysteine peptidase n=1 Tax=Sphingomonas montanisoli TaxID=2606412 RepID=A0A5D9CD32_9SPHN|nr:transglutaminase-like cysteine peptidase [Sphingomonas montanisoli]TZG29569.1 transglutaminase-like cysteine peptidase [Sphingomonas montanisoli]
MSIDVVEAPECASLLPAESVPMLPRRPAFRARILMIVAINSLLWGAILWLLLGCAMPSAQSATMRTGGITMPPAGWLGYCGRHAGDPGCGPVALDDRRWRELEGALSSVAHVMRRHDRREQWETAGKTGDCEDIALAMRADLLGKGWPVEAVRLATAWTERGDYHVVLTLDGARRGQGPSTFVLDSRFDRIMTYSELIARGYRFHMRQAGRGPYWLTAA